LSSSSFPFLLESSTSAPRGRGRKKREKKKGREGGEETVKGVGLLLRYLLVLVKEGRQVGGGGRGGKKKRGKEEEKGAAIKVFGLDEELKARAEREGEEGERKGRGGGKKLQRVWPTVLSVYCRIVEASIRR